MGEVDGRSFVMELSRRYNDTTDFVKVGWTSRTKCTPGHYVHVRSSLWSRRMLALRQPLLWSSREDGLGSERLQATQIWDWTFGQASD